MSILDKFKEWWSGQQSEADQVAMLLEQAEKAVWSTAMVNDFPDGSFLYVKPGGTKDDGGKTVPRSLRMFPYRDGDGAVDLPHLRNALARIPQADLPQGVKDRLTSRAQALLENANSKEMRASGTFGLITDKQGRLRWVSIVSNNFKDREGEVLTAAAHKEFAAAVNAGTAPYPELRVWHVPHAGIGKADFVDYHANFMIQSGTFYPGMERVAEKLAATKNLGTSHGFFGTRHEKDWTWYRSYETSVLPLDAAANALTSWEVVGGSKMEHRDKLVSLLGEDLTKQIEKSTEEAGAAAAAAGVEQKSTDAPAPDLTAIILSVKALSDQVATLPEQVAAAVKAANGDTSDRLTVVETAVKGLATLTKQVQDLTRSDDQKVADQFKAARDTVAPVYRASGDPQNAPTQEQIKEVGADRDWLDQALHFLPTTAGGR